MTKSNFITAVAKAVIESMGTYYKHTSQLPDLAPFIDFLQILKRILGHRIVIN